MNFLKLFLNHSHKTETILFKVFTKLWDGVFIGHYIEKGVVAKIIAFENCTASNFVEKGLRDSQQMFIESLNSKNYWKFKKFNFWLHFFCSWRLSASLVVWYILAIHSLWSFRFGLSLAPSVSFRHMRSFEHCTQRLKWMRQRQQVYLLEYLFMANNVTSGNG